MIILVKNKMQHLKGHSIYSGKNIQIYSGQRDKVRTAET